MNRKEIKEILEKEGYGFTAFKSWFQRHYQMGVTYIVSKDTLLELVSKYDSYRNKGSFQERHNINYSSFRNWVERTKFLKMSELTTEYKEELIQEYRLVQFKTNTSKDTFISVISKLMYDEEMEEHEYSVYEYIRDMEEE